MVSCPRVIDYEKIVIEHAI
jgi:hypothetical protein